MSLIPFSCIDLLDGFFSLETRSSTLHGDAPLRAVQACPPFLEGSGYGFELRYSGLGLAVDHGIGQIQMLDELAADFDYAGILQSARAGGYLSEFWHQRLSQGWWWRGTEAVPHLHLWTGLLIRPTADFLALCGDLTNAPNLCQPLAETVISEPNVWVPLVLDLKPTESPNLLQGLCAGVTPLPQFPEIQITPLADQPRFGQRILEYYDPAYFEQKLAAPPTQKYARQLRTHEPVLDWSEAGDLLVLAPSEMSARTVQLHNWRTAAESNNGTNNYAAIQPDADMHFRFGGRGLHVQMGEQWPAAFKAARTTWEAVYGTKGAEYLDNMTFDGESSAHTTQGPPLILANIEPLVRFATRPGWSLLFDATSSLAEHDLAGNPQGPNGLRGLIRAEHFHSGAFAFQWHRQPEQLTITRTQPLGRVFPVPNELLDTTLEIQRLPID